MKYTNNEVRRQDRLLDEQRAVEILREGEYGVLSMCAADDNGAYGIPLSYVWDGQHSIYIHCAPEGRKLRCIDACASVSFCIVGRTNVVSAKFTTGYESVVMRCTARHHLSEEERRSALRLFVHKYCPGQEDMGNIYMEKSFHRTEIIRLDILEMSGKAKNIF